MKMAVITVTKRPIVFIWAFTLTSCFAANASQAMLVMVIYVERTLTWMAGPMLIYTVLRMPPTTARR